MTKLVLFGITGDLSRRKLLPALNNIFENGRTDLEIIGVSRREVDVAALLGEAGASALSNITRVFTMDLSNGEDYLGLKKDINLQNDDHLIIYLSVPPDAALEIVELLGKAGLNTQNVKLMIEKPFGSDFDSAKEFLDSMTRYYNESQIYRIDHYLAKEMAQNLAAIRIDDSFLDNIWNNHSVKEVKIIASEEIGIEGRNTFYEQTGALRDLIQGHLMELLALVLMDKPKSLEDVPKLRSAALNNIKIANPSKAMRGQYETYKEEVQNTSSNTETFACVELESESNLWQGVPIHLITGKALDKKLTQIHLTLKSGKDFVIRIQPNEGVEIPQEIKDFDDGNLEDIAPSSQFKEAYEQVFLAAINGQKSLFVTSGEILQSWKILAPIQEAWAKDAAGLKIYKEGSTIDYIL